MLRVFGTRRRTAVLERSGLQELPRAEVKKVELSGIKKKMDIKQVEFSAHRAWLWDTERL